MIRHERDITYITPLGVTKQMREAAAKRRGEWAVITYDWDEEHPELGCLGRVSGVCMAKLCGYHEGSKVLQRTVVRFREDEIPRILHMFTHGTRNGSKLESIHANIEQTAESLWPTGSLEHIAMRFLATPLLVRVFVGHRIQPSCLHAMCAGCCCLAERGEMMKTRLVRVDGLPTGALTQCDGEDAITSIADGKGKKEEKPRVQPPPPAAPAAAPRPLPPPVEAPVQMRMEDSIETPGLKLPGVTLRRTESTFVCPDREVIDYSPPRAPPEGFPIGGAPQGGDLMSPAMQMEGVREIPTEVQQQKQQKDPAPRVLMLGELPRHGGCTPEDADIIANECLFGGRTMDIDGIKLIIGQDYGNEDKDNKQIVGVLTAPTPKRPNVYNNSSRNARSAKIKRLDEKAREYTGTKKDRRKIATLIAQACGDSESRGIWSRKRVERWAHEFFHLEEIRSGKWSVKRLEDSLNNLFKQAYPQFNLKCAVKLEPMPEGKPPRLLIADGDDGQLMALVTVKCFEDLLFEWFESKSIKHAGKRSAINRCIKSLTKKGARLIEGDGSAWDTTCNCNIRGQVENPVLQHIMSILVPFGVVPEQWHAEHMAICEKKKLKLFFQKKLDKMRMTINAIRRSGHRGTSCLNWWMNFVNWTCSIFKQPERFLDPTVRKGEDETGHERWWNGAFEGDDSLCAMKPPMREGDKMHEIFIDWWKRQGFNMVIITVDRRATFCGYHIACEYGEPTGFAAPELPRALMSAGISCSASIVEAGKAGDVRKVKDLCAASAIARASDFAGLYPSVSRKYHNYARSLKQSRDVSDREMSMRVFGREGHTFNEIDAIIESMNLGVTPTMEQANLEAVMCPATWRELDAFTLYDWSFEAIGRYEEMLASLPESWRPPP